MNKQREIQRNVEKWRARLGLHRWKIRYTIHERPRDEDPSEGVTTSAECIPDPTYLRLQLNIYPDFWTGDKEEREQTIIHELAHALTAKLADLAEDGQIGKLVTPETINDTNEDLTEWIASALWCLDREYKK